MTQLKILWPSHRIFIYPSLGHLCVLWYDDFIRTMARARGIVIHQEDFREADRIYTCYTKERGKLDVHAKGVRKITAKLKPELELLSFLEFEYVEGKRYPIVTHVEAKAQFSRMKENLEALEVALRLAGTLRKVLKGEEANEPMWRLLLGALSYLEEHSDEIHRYRERLVTFFNCKLIRYLGVMPNLEECVHCARSFARHHMLFFGSGVHGAFCDGCTQEGIHLIRLSPAMREKLISFFEKNWMVVHMIPLFPEEEIILSDITQVFMESVI